MALNIYSTKSGFSKSNLQVSETIPVESEEGIAFWIFNLDPKGYIIISADDAAEPLLGYGLNDNLDFEKAPPGLLGLLEGYKAEINIIRKEKIEADEKIKNKWDTYSSPEYAPLKSYSPCEFLLETTWGQKDPYNAECPLDSEGDTCVVGCGGTALAQILHYWGCRVFPDHSRSYTPPGFSSPLTVYFYNQDYDWDAMSHTSADSDNQLFLYHCAVACQSEFGSSETTSALEGAAVALYLNYGFEMDGIEEEDDYTSSSTWINMLKDDIDEGRPILYRGRHPNDASSSHAWVVDGYDTDNRFHCNWGWGGDYNDWYSLSDLTPGTAHNYNSGQKAILGAMPKLDACDDIPGSVLLCDASNESYTISIPYFASVVWSKSSNLVQVGGNTGTTYTVNRGSNVGTRTIVATIKNTQGNTFLIRTKDITLGAAAPGISTAWDSENNCYVTGAFEYDTPYVWQMETVNPSGSSSNYIWEVWGYDLALESANMSMVSTESSYPYTAYGKQLSYTFYTEPFYTIKAKQYMCGSWSNWEETYVSVSGGSGLSLLISPNPAVDIATVSIAELDEEVGLKSASIISNEGLITEWELEVYDQNQMLLEKQNKLRGSTTSIKTNGWKEGVYIVRVSYDCEVLQGKLVVKNSRF